ncbi:MAG: SUMF1/EgtB/PvdO family nonheme iron enzyme [Armatimonadia bacterium]|nr:SUMF1/EgtB/PvdO family nonheme iron enzyme [Armatimonadia bacterium]
MQYGACRKVWNMFEKNEKYCLDILSCLHYIHFRDRIDAGIYVLFFLSIFGVTKVGFYIGKQLWRESMMKNTAMAWLLIVLVFAVASCSDDDSTGSKDSTAPLVEIQTPWDGTTREGVVDVVIAASDNSEVKRVEFYANDTLVGTDTTAPYELEWDLSSYADGTQIEIYAKAVDIHGNAKTTTTWTLTKGPSRPPNASITGPADGWTVMQGYLTTFTGTAKDPEDGALTNENIAWSSDLQGSLDVGLSLDYRGLIIGDHVITMTATDSDGNTVTQTINITVTENDQDYAYVQNGTYTIGPPLFEPVSVTISRPFLISKKELTLREFRENYIFEGTFDDFEGDFMDTFLNRETDITERWDEDGVALVMSPEYLDYDNYGDTYGDYPAVCYNIHEFIMYCESLNITQGYNRSYMFYDDLEIAEKASKVNKAVLMNREDTNYDLNGWRLPSEAEWIIAASGGNAGRKYPWGDQRPGSRCNSLDDPSPPNMLNMTLGRGTVPVDSYAEYANPFGILNMAGNVAEMVSDIYVDAIPEGVDPVGYTEDEEFEYLVKGGSYYSPAEQVQIGMRTQWIGYYGKKDSNGLSWDSGMGVRLVRSLHADQAPW